MKLKKEYWGATITRGDITFDSRKVNQSEYPIYYEKGFSDLFDLESNSTEKGKKVPHSKK